MLRRLVRSSRPTGIFCVVALAVAVCGAPSTVSAAPVPAATAPGADRASAAAPPAAGAFVPVVASRIVDSRVGVQVRGPVPGFGAVGVQVTGRAGVPGAVGAVVVTVTVVSPRASGYLQVWPAGAVRPATSNLNFQPGQTIANTVMVPVGAGGRIEVANGSADGVDLLVDVTGYTLAGPATVDGTIVPVQSARIVDSRVGLQARPPLPGFRTVGLQVVGRGGVPGSGTAGAVLVTVAAVAPRAAGYLQVWPAGVPRPATSSLNFAAGQDISTTLVVPVGAGGRIEVFSASAGDVDLVVDINGYLIGSPTAPGFAHPGILVGSEQLDFVRAKINAGAEPWTSALANAMKAKADSGGNAGVAYSSPSWTPRPRAYVGCGSHRSPDEGCSDELNDSIAAYTKALRWYYTGDADAARGAIAIMNAWSSTLVDHRFDATYSDGHLQAAWVGEVFPRAAEIIRYSYSPGRGDPALNVAGFSGMLDRAYLPHVIDGWYGGGANWLISMAEATMNIGIFTDDYATFDAGVAAWRAQVPAAIYLSGDSNTIPGLAGMPISPPDTMYAHTSTSRSSLGRYWYTPTRFISGLEGESCRDINHMAMGLGAMINGAETARLQGVDLYGEEQDRIVAALELNSGYVHDAVAGGQNPPANWVCPNPVNTTNGAWKVTWEIGYNHYANRLGIAMPHARQLLLDVVRPSAWRSSGHLDYETLTHAGTP